MHAHLTGARTNIHFRGEPEFAEALRYVQIGSTQIDCELTVYELIDLLSRYPSDAKVELCIEGAALIQHQGATHVKGLPGGVVRISGRV